MSPPSPPEAEPSAEPRVRPLGTAGGYDLLVEIAAGGMATVFLARERKRADGSGLVAVKRPHKHLASDTTYLSMLLDEARLASAIDHPNVVRVRELGFELGEPFIVMDYVEGASLAELRKELSEAGRTLPLRVAMRIVLDALAGLHAAHVLKDESGRPLGIIHRDVSPHNVLVGCDGRTRLTDFGIAKAVDRVQVTRTHEVKGKLAYLAPERIDKRRLCTVQSDVFSMAVVLWECLAGRRLFRGDEAIDTLQEVLSAPIPRLRRLGAKIPAVLDEAIARGLSRDLEARYKTAEEFARALELAAGADHVGTADEVAEVVETVFGARMRLRHDQIRDALPATDAEEALARTGVPSRAPASAEMRVASPDAIALLAPLAPSARYTFGAAGAELTRQRSRVSWRMILAVACGGILGAGLVLVMSARSGSSRAEVVLSPPPAVSERRHVEIPLPFVASAVLIDGVRRELNPTADHVAFDFGGDQPHEHHLVAFGLDGTRAEGKIRENAGRAEVGEDGFLVTAPPPPTRVIELGADGAVGAGDPLAADSGKAQGRSRPRTKHGPAQAAGTTRNGFTKLK